MKVRQAKKIYRRNMEAACRWRQGNYTCDQLVGAYGVLGRLVRRHGNAVLVAWHRNINAASMLGLTGR